MKRKQQSKKEKTELQYNIDDINHQFSEIMENKQGLTQDKLVSLMKQELVNTLEIISPTEKKDIIVKYIGYWWGKVKNFDLKGVDIRGINFQELAKELPNECIEGVDFGSSDFSQQDLSNISIDSCYFSNSNPHRTDLRGTRFFKTSMKAVNLSRCIIDNGTEWVSCSFIRCNLSGLDLSNSNSPDTRWDDDMSMTECSLVAVTLEGNELDESIFDGSNMESASLKGAQLWGTSFIGCNMVNVDFENVQMCGDPDNENPADFTNAILIGARNLTKATGLKPAELQSAISDPMKLIKRFNAMLEGGINDTNFSLAKKCYNVANALIDRKVPFQHVTYNEEDEVAVINDFTQAEITEITPRLKKVIANAKSNKSFINRLKLEIRAERQNEISGVTKESKGNYPYSMRNFLNIFGAISKQPSKILGLKDLPDASLVNIASYLGANTTRSSCIEVKEVFKADMDAIKEGRSKLQKFRAETLRATGSSSSSSSSSTSDSPSLFGQKPPLKKRRAEPTDQAREGRAQSSLQASRNPEAESAHLSKK